MSNPAPLKKARIVALLVAWAWAVVASGVGLNALIESRRSKTAFKALVQPPTRITIDVSDMNDSGTVSTCVSLFISVLTSNMLFMMLIGRTAALATRTARIQAGILAFCCTWLFAVQVPVTLIFATRRAKVRAFVGTIELPAALVQAAEARSGSTGVYKQLSYLRLVAILPWFTLLFTIIAAVVLFIAGSRAASAAKNAPVPTKDLMSEKEKNLHVEDA